MRCNLLFFVWRREASRLYGIKIMTSGFRCLNRPLPENRADFLAVLLVVPQTWVLLFLFQL